MRAWRWAAGRGAATDISRVTSEGLAAISSNRRRTAAALAGRSSVFLASSSRTRVPSGRGTLGLCHHGAMGWVLRCWEMIDTASPPMKGGRPVRSS